MLNERQIIRELYVYLSQSTSLRIGGSGQHTENSYNVPAFISCIYTYFVEFSYFSLCIYFALLANQKISANPCTFHKPKNFPA